MPIIFIMWLAVYTKCSEANVNHYLLKKLIYTFCKHIFMMTLAFHGGYERKWLIALAFLNVMNMQNEAHTVTAYVDTTQEIQFRFYVLFIIQWRKENLKVCSLIILMNSFLLLWEKLNYHLWYFRFEDSLEWFKVDWTTTSLLKFDLTFRRRLLFSLHKFCFNTPITLNYLNNSWRLYLQVLSVANKESVRRMHYHNQVTRRSFSNAWFATSGFSWINNDASPYPLQLCLLHDNRWTCCYDYLTKVVTTTFFFPGNCVCILQSRFHCLKS